MAEMRPQQCPFRTEPSACLNAASLRLQVTKMRVIAHKAAHHLRLYTT